MRGKVMAGKLNVRRRPDKDGLKIGTLLQNSLVDILGEMNRWLEIKYSGGSAFVHSDFIERIETPKPLKGKVTASLVNVRSAASSGSDVLGKIAGNTVVDIFSEQGEWLEIRFNEQQAY